MKKLILSLMAAIGLLSLAAFTNVALASLNTDIADTTCGGNPYETPDLSLVPFLQWPTCYEPYVLDLICAQQVQDEYDAVVNAAFDTAKKAWAEACQTKEDALSTAWGLYSDCILAGVSTAVCDALLAVRLTNAAVTFVAAKTAIATALGQSITNAYNKASNDILDCCKPV